MEASFVGGVEADDVDKSFGCKCHFFAVFTYLKSLAGRPDCLDSSDAAGCLFLPSANILGT